jgi:hypothetical protein
MKDFRMFHAGPEAFSDGLVTVILFLVPKSYAPFMGFASQVHRRVVDYPIIAFHP